MAVGIVGAVLMTSMLLFAAIPWRLAVSARAFERLLTRTPVTPVAHAVHGTVVALCGTVVPSEQGVVSSPSGRSVVLYDATAFLEKHKSLGKRVQREHEFWLQDETGAYARIIPNAARLLVRITRYRHQSASVVMRADIRCVPMSTEIHAWATASRGADAADLAVDELFIAPGDRVLALGFAERVADGTLLLRHHARVELFLSTLSVAEVKEDHQREARICSKIMLIFLGVSAIGALLLGGAIVVSMLLQ